MNWLKFLKYTICLMIIPLFLVAKQQDLRTQISEISETPNGTNWIRFKKDNNINARNIFKVLKESFHLGIHDKMRLIQVQSDELGYTHYRYQQYYKDVKVEGAQYYVHERNGFTRKANGKVIKDLSLDTSPSISSARAIEMAMKQVPAKKYMWEERDEEKILQSLINDKNASYLPRPELRIVRTADKSDNRQSKYSLAYKINIYTKIPLGGFSVYLDAHSGKLIKKISLLKFCEAGFANTLYNSSQAINTELTETGDKLGTKLYRLFDDCRIDDGIHTQWKKNDGGNFTEVWDGDNTWLSDQAPATSAHWAAGITFDYFLDKHNRNSFDNDGGKMLNRVQDDSCKRAAFWNGKYVTYCKERTVDSDPDYWVALDVVGHEWTHGVTEHSVEDDLEYQGESGALNESFSDIFGTMVEFYDNGGVSDWTIAEDIRTLRDMSNPNRFNDPHTYKGQFWWPTDTSADNGGVHVNSGVMNFWFYLLSSGGSGQNDVGGNLGTGDSYFVTGIGVEEAARITYRNLTIYMQNESQYLDAYKGAAWAAEDLYGLYSEEFYQTVNAWYAVGVRDGRNVVVQGPYEKTKRGDPIIYPDQELYSAANSIVTDAVVYPLLNGAEAAFFAGKSIQLNPGFIVEGGGNFRASIFPRDPSGTSSIAASIFDDNSLQPHNLQSPNLQAHPVEFALNPNYPNPFNPETKISFTLPEPAHVKLKIYNVLGEVVAILRQEKMPAGHHQSVWSGKNPLGNAVSSGIYFYRLEAVSDNGKRFVQTRKMSLLR